MVGGVVLVAQTLETQLSLVVLVQELEGVFDHSESLIRELGSNGLDEVGVVDGAVVVEFIVDGPQLLGGEEHSDFG